jgi:hypothetical protein
MIARPGVKIWPLMMMKFAALAGSIREHNKRTMTFLIIKVIDQQRIAQWSIRN